MTEQMILTELGYLQRQAMIEKLTRRFAALNGYTIEPDTHILEAQHPQIRMWVAMAELAIDEVEQEILSIGKND